MVYCGQLPLKNKGRKSMTAQVQGQHQQTQVTALSQPLSDANMFADTCSAQVWRHHTVFISVPKSAVLTDAKGCIQGARGCI